MSTKRRAVTLVIGSAAGLGLAEGVTSEREDIRLAITMITPSAAVAMGPDFTVKNLMRSAFTVARNPGWRNVG